MVSTLLPFFRFSPIYWGTFKEESRGGAPSRKEIRRRGTFKEVEQRGEDLKEGEKGEGHLQGRNAGGGAENRGPLKVGRQGYSQGRKAGGRLYGRRTGVLSRQESRRGDFLEGELPKKENRGTFEEVQGDDFKGAK